MNGWLEHLLRCPFCGGTVSRVLEVAAGARELTYGLIACADCLSEFPVIEGIPLLFATDVTLDVKAETLEDSVFRGPKLSEIIEAVRRSDTVGALALLLSPSDYGEFGFHLSRPDDDLNGVVTHLSADAVRLRVSRLANRILRAGYRRLSRSQILGRNLANAYRRFVLPRQRWMLAEYLTRYDDRLFADDVIDIYYRRYSGSEMANYFMYRFGQPRHLAALSLASVLDSVQGSILDIACGAGHLTHYLSYGRPEQNVVGLDRDFVRLFIAKRFVAPRAQFVCTMADIALPFSDQAFDGILCSDAFHYFRYKSRGVREMQRTLMPEGVLVLTRVANRAVEPHEGYEMEEAGYRRLFSDMPHVILTETQLRHSYLQKHGPDLSQRGNGQGAHPEKWLSLVATHRPGILTDGVGFKDWPHAKGRLGVNPIFVPAGPPREGGRTFRFTFPSQWYEFEDAAYRDYAPEMCDLSNDVLQSLREGKRTGPMDELVRQMVIIGMPDRYIHPRW